MRSLAAFSLHAITTDRTGGRTKTGFEYEDFIGEGESFAESLGMNETTAGSQGKVGLRLVAENDSSLERVADTLVAALIMAIDQVLSREAVSNRLLYTALSASLREKLWQPEVLPTGGLTFGFLTGTGEKTIQPVQAFDEEPSFSYRHESPAVTKAFMQIARGFRPETQESKALYSPENLE